MAKWGAGDINDDFYDTPRKRSVFWLSEALMIPHRVLVLEDNLIIAMEAEDVLRKIGAEVIDIASNLEEAVAAIDAGSYDLALLDVNLGEAMSFSFARLLKERGVAFGFVSGYSDTQDFPDDLQGAPLLVKPFDEWAMQQFLAKLFPV